MISDIQDYLDDLAEQGRRAEEIAEHEAQQSCPPEEMVAEETRGSHRANNS